MTLETLTLISTTCIVLSGLSLLVGWYFIRWRKNLVLHRNTMLMATIFAALFLVAYVTRWAVFGSKPFEGEGGWRLFYFANLVPHVILAIAVGPLALYLIYLALRKRNFRQHRRIARITLPIWLYVAASGWLIYYLLYKATF
jgi:putative membrane protein